MHISWKEQERKQHTFGIELKRRKKKAYNQTDWQIDRETDRETGRESARTTLSERARDEQIDWCI